MPTRRSQSSAAVRHPKHAGVPTFELLYAFPKRSQLTQQSAAISEQLFASGGQEKAATDTVKKLEPAFVFEIADLPRQSRLAGS
jgi:hypothetical protein